MPPRTAALATAALAIAFAAGLDACAPTKANTTYTAGSIGVAAQVRYGTIVGMRPVRIAGSNSGAGTLVGGLAGGAIGSTIGGDWRARAAPDRTDPPRGSADQA